MGFLKNIFKTTLKTGVYTGDDAGGYFSEDGKLGIFIEGNNEEARREAVGYLKNNLKNIGEDDPKGKIRETLEKLNENFCTLDKIVSVIVFYQLEKYLAMAHIGVSRAYVIRENEIIQLTEDDTEGWNLFKAGLIAEERLLTSPLNRMETKALGKNERLQLNTLEYYFSQGEKILVMEGVKAMKYGDEKLYDILGGKSENCVEKFSEKNFLLKIL